MASDTYIQAGKIVTAYDWLSHAESGIDHWELITTWASITLEEGRSTECEVVTIVRHIWPGKPFPFDHETKFVDKHTLRILSMQHLRQEILRYHGGLLSGWLGF